MSSGKKNKAYDQREAQWNAAAHQQFQKASEVSPLQKAYEDKQLRFLNWDNSKDKNVADAPGMSDYIQIGQAAIGRAERDKMGSGAIALSDGGASGYIEKLRSQRKAEAGNEFGAGLENAQMNLRAEAQGSVLPLAQFNYSRNAGLAGLASQNTNAYMNRPRETPFWQKLLMGGIAGGAQVATGYVGRG